MENGAAKMNNKCSICLQVKGKRSCRISQGDLVCPACCARIRNQECTGCSHYDQATRYTEGRSKQSLSKHFTCMIIPEVNKAVDRALELAEKGQFAKAEAMMTALSREYPRIHRVAFGMGTLLALKGRHREALAYFDKAIDIFPYFAEAWNNRGQVCLELRDVGGTLKSYQKVVEFGDPREDFTMEARKTLLRMENSIREETGLSMERYIESLDEYDRAFELMANRDYEKALDGFHRVRAINPNSPQTYGNIGLCCALLGKKEEALAAFDQALRIDPQYQPAIDNKKVFLSLKKGESMADGQIKIVQYYADIAEKKGRDGRQATLRHSIRPEYW